MKPGDPRARDYGRAGGVALAKKNAKMVTLLDMLRAPSSLLCTPSRGCIWCATIHSQPCPAHPQRLTDGTQVQLFAEAVA